MRVAFLGHGSDGIKSSQARCQSWVHRVGSLTMDFVGADSQQDQDSQDVSAQERLCIFGSYSYLSAGYDAGIVHTGTDMRSDTHACTRRSLSGGLRAVSRSIRARGE